MARKQDWTEVAIEVIVNMATFLLFMAVAALIIWLLSDNVVEGYGLDYGSSFALSIIIFEVFAIGRFAWDYNGSKK